MCVNGLLVSGSGSRTAAASADGLGDREDGRADGVRVTCDGVALIDGRACHVLPREQWAASVYVYVRGADRLRCI